MPIYEYTCIKCNETREYLILNEDKDKPISCVKCGGELKRVISQSSFRLIGDGWYAPSSNKETTKKDSC